MKDRDLAQEDRLASLFQPDTLVPVQFFDRLRRRSELDAERRLLIAVLEDAIEVYRKKVTARDRRGRQLFEDAEQWIESTDRTWLFSFENVCDLLELDPEYLRRGLHRLKERATAGQRGRVVSLHPPDGEEMRRASGH